MCTQGGGLSWNGIEPNNIPSNTFINNKASIYGNSIGSIVLYIGFITQEQYNSMSKYNVQLYSQYNQVFTSKSVYNHTSGTAIETLYIGLFDTYGNIVSYGYSDKIEARKNYVSQKFPITLTGSTSFLINNGVAKIEDLELFCTPNSTQTITFVYADSITLNLTVNVRPCIVGEQLLSNGACLLCPGPTQYSLQSNFDSEVTCSSCPFYAKCMNGSEMYPNSGYWRYNNTTIDFILCINEKACLGYDESDKNLQGKCGVGYSGILCDTCEVGYFKSTGYSCAKCPSLYSNIISIIVFLICVFIYISFTIKSIYKEEYDEK